jgi:hypothetical protein
MLCHRDQSVKSIMTLIVLSDFDKGIELCKFSVRAILSYPVPHDKAADLML